MCKKAIVLILLTALLLEGCAGVMQNPVSSQDSAAFFSMENEAVITYEVPTAYPHIITDQLGYDVNTKKQVFMFGKELPDSFRLIDEATGKAVYDGPVENRGYFKECGTDVGIADFSEYTTIGRYYV